MLSWMSYIHPYDSLVEFKNKDPQKYEALDLKFHAFEGETHKYLGYNPFVLADGNNLKSATIRIPKVFIVIKIVEQFNSILDMLGTNLRSFFKLEPATISNATPAIKLLTSLINGNLYFSPEELQRRTIHCNFVIKHKLESIGKDIVNKKIS